MTFRPDTNYFNGQGRNPDHTLAFKWANKASDGGSAFGKYYLGYMYYTAEGVPLDKAKAFDLFYQAAGQIPMAQYCLGIMYENGEGVERDILIAIEWYRKAANNGVKGAQETLTRLSVQDDGKTANHL